MPQNGNSGLANLAYYNGSPVGVSTQGFNPPVNSLVLDVTNGILYIKTSTDNATYLTVATTAGAQTPSSIAATGAITTSSPTARFGYTTGAGGAVTQITSKATGVTLAKRTGDITLNNASLAAGAEATFTVANTTVIAGDIGIINHVSAGTSGAYDVSISNIVAATSFDVTVTNWSAGALGEAIVVRYALQGGANA